MIAMIAGMAAMKDVFIVMIAMITGMITGMAAMKDVLIVMIAMIAGITAMKMH